MIRPPWPPRWLAWRTTIEAQDILHANGRRMKTHRKNVDAVAAALILEGYLVKKRQQRASETTP